MKHRYTCQDIHQEEIFKTKTLIVALHNSAQGLHQQA
jgi:hypothetical protein